MTLELWMGSAHAASIAVANAALAAAGYRTSRERHHERLIDSLIHTVGADPKMIRSLHDQRVSRNRMTYERAGTVTEEESHDALIRARRLAEQVKSWLARQHPGLTGGRGSHV